MHRGNGPCQTPPFIVTSSYNGRDRLVGSVEKLTLSRLRIFLLNEAQIQCGQLLISIRANYPEPQSTRLLTLFSVTDIKDCFLMSSEEISRQQMVDFITRQRLKWSFSLPFIHCDIPL